MRRATLFASLLTGALGLAAIGCGTTKPPPVDQPAPAPAVQPSQEQTVPGTSAAEASPTAAGPAAATAGKAQPKAAPGKSPVEPAKPAAAPPPTAVATKEPAPAPAAPAPKAVAPAAAPAEPVRTAEAAAPAAPAHAKVGPEKCMMCHRVQYTSWNESKHKAKGLDCEGCHGNGADYKAMAVMKDRAAAMKAGLILPGLVFCKKCHAKADASMLPLVHAHKVK